MSPLPTLRRPRGGPPPWTVSALGLAVGWVALFSWSRLVASPARFLVPALLVGSVLVAVGVGLRRLAVPWPWVAGAQVLVGLAGLGILAAGSPAGALPTETSVRRTAAAVWDGAAALNTYAAPVSESQRGTAVLLLACGLLVLLAVDVLTSMGLAPLAAVPLLVTLSVPVAILVESLSPLVLAGTTVLFVQLLGAESDHALADRLRSQRMTWDPGRGTTGALRWTVSATAVVGALLIAPLVPVADLLDRGRGDGSGGGTGAGSFELTTVNPLIRLRRELVEQTATPMLFARTADRDTSYVRTTALDQFAADTWRASPRQLPPENEVNGELPSPPGLGPAVPGTLVDWELKFAPGFVSSWLPLPYPARTLEAGRGWRYDPRTLDVALVAHPPTPGLEYRAEVFDPQLDPALLDDAPSAPGDLLREFTELPDDLPDVIAERAREVTRGAEDEYARAVALQEWFREKGGFEYSLGRRPGSGLDLLADFVTDDRVGYCEQFAAAMAVMARSLDIPARVAVGFLDGTPQPDGRILYTSDDRHAWPELYFSGVGWVIFEPTPGQRTGASPAWTQPRTAVDPASPSAVPTPTTAPSQTPSPDQESATTGGSGGVVPWRTVVLSVLALTLLLAPSAVRVLLRRRRLAPGPGLAEGAWRELRATALDLRLDWPERRSPREQATALVAQTEADDDARRRLEGLLVAVERGRYAGPRPGRPGGGSGRVSRLDRDRGAARDRGPGGATEPAGATGPGGAAGAGGVATLVSPPPARAEDAAADGAPAGSRSSAAAEPADAQGVESGELQRVVVTWRRLMASSVGRGPRWRARLWPVSLVSRRR